MLRFWHDLFAFYHTLTPAIKSLKQTYNSPVFGHRLAAASDAKRKQKKVSSHGNCLTFAIAQKRRLGGHIITVKSRYGWWCHAYWLSEEGVVYEFAPVEKHRKVQKLWHPLPPLVYEGKQRVAPVVPQEALRKIHALGGVREVVIQRRPAKVAVEAMPALQVAAAA